MTSVTSKHSVTLSYYHTSLNASKTKIESIYLLLFPSKSRKKEYIHQNCAKSINDILESTFMWIIGVTGLY